MSTNTVPLSNPVASKIYENTSSNATASSVKASSATAYQVKIDNSLNSAAVYTKLYNVSSAPTVGTTAPHVVIRTAAGLLRTVTLGQGEGVAFGTGIFEATVTAGGTGGTTAPTNSVPIKIEYT